MEEAAAKEAAAIVAQKEPSTVCGNELAAQNSQPAAPTATADDRPRTINLGTACAAADTDTLPSPPDITSTDDALVVDDGQTRTRRKIIVSAGGEALAREREVKTAKALKAAETRERNKRARAAGEEVDAAAKKPRLSASKKKTAGKK